MSTKPKARRAALALCGLILFAALSAPAALARQEGQVAGVTPAQAEAAQAESKSSVYGKAVFEETGRPVRRARVVLLPFVVNESGADRAALTNAEGEFRLTKVPPGRYYVAVDMKGVLSPISFLDLETLIKSRTPDMAQVGKNFDSIEVDGKADKEVTVRARRGAAIGGRVTYADGDPAVNIVVHLMRIKDGRPVPFLNGLGPAAVFGLRTDDRGIYRVAGLPPGEYVIGVAEAVEHAGDDEGVNRHGYASEYGSIGSPFGITFYPSARQPADATAINLDAGEEREGVDIQIAERESRTIAGLVRGKRDKAPVQGASISLIAKEQSPTIIAHLYGNGAAQSTSTNEAGRWLFKELPDGVYTVSVRPRPNYAQEEYEATAADEGEEEEVEPPRRQAAKRKPKRLAPREQEVRVSGGDVNDMVIELGEGANISGTVVFEGSAAGEHGYVNIYVAQTVRGEERHVGSGSMVSGGKFSIEGVPPGKILLRLSQYSPAAKKRYIKSVTWRGKDILREPPEVAEGAELDGVQVVLATDAATLNVRAVTGKGKSPAGGVQVSLVSANPSNWQRSDAQAVCVTDDDGLCTLTTAPGEYLVITLPGGGDRGALTPAEIKEHAATATRLKLQASEKKSFEVVIQ